MYTYICVYIDYQYVYIISMRGIADSNVTIARRYGNEVVPLLKLRFLFAPDSLHSPSVTSWIAWITHTYIPEKEGEKRREM